MFFFPLFFFFGELMQNNRIAELSARVKLEILMYMYLQKSFKFFCQLYFNWCTHQLILLNSVCIQGSIGQHSYQPILLLINLLVN